MGRWPEFSLSAPGAGWRAPPASFLPEDAGRPGCCRCCRAWSCRWPRCSASAAGRKVRTALPCPGRPLRCVDGHAAPHRPHPYVEVQCPTENPGSLASGESGVHHLAPPGSLIRGSLAWWGGGVTLREVEEAGVAWGAGGELNDPLPQGIAHPPAAISAPGFPVALVRRTGPCPCGNYPITICLPSLRPALQLTTPAFPSGTPATPSGHPAPSLAPEAPPWPLPPAPPPQLQLTSGRPAEFLQQEEH